MMVHRRGDILGVRVRHCWLVGAPWLWGSSGGDGLDWVTWAADGATTLQGLVIPRVCGVRSVPGGAGSNASLCSARRSVLGPGRGLPWALPLLVLVMQLRCLQLLPGVSPHVAQGAHVHGGRGLGVLAGEHRRALGPVLVHHDVVSRLGLGITPVSWGRLLALGLWLRLRRRPRDAGVTELRRVLAMARHTGGSSVRPRGGQVQDIRGRCGRGRSWRGPGLDLRLVTRLRTAVTPIPLNWDRRGIIEHPVEAESL